MPSTSSNIRSLAAGVLILTLTAGCVASPTKRSDPQRSDPAQSTANADTAQQNLDEIKSRIRSYAIDNQKFERAIDAHLFGIPGLTSLGKETGSLVLADIKSSGGFGKRKAYEPITTDPSKRWQPEDFFGNQQQPDPTGSTSTPTSGSDSDGSATAVEMSNRVIAAGGKFLLSALSTVGMAEKKGEDKPATSAPPESTEQPAKQGPTVRILLTDTQDDSTLSGQKLFAQKIDESTVTVDKYGTLNVAGKAVEESALTPLGKDVQKSLHTPVQLPNQPDERSPDYSCELIACVALTYDDGPGDAATEERLLSDTEAAKIRVTYFFLGQNVNNDPGTAKKIAEAGHEIANHSYSHPQLSAIGGAGVKSQMKKTDDAIDKAVGRKPDLMRPPYGALNAGSERALGHPAIMWDVDTEDWRHKDPEKTVASVKANAKPGSVVLMHSIHPTTVDAAPKVYETVAEMGLYPVTVTELFDGLELKKNNRYFCRGYFNELCSNPEHPTVKRGS